MINVDNYVDKCRFCRYAQCFWGSWQLFDGKTRYVYILFVKSVKCKILSINMLIKCGKLLQ